MDVIDLDVLRPAKRIIKLAGKEVDVSFIPCAITWDVDNLINKISSYDKDEILSGGEKTKEVFDLSIKLCSLFCEHNYPEMNEEWFEKNVDAIQIRMFVSIIKEALNNAYKGIEASPKN